ncbi:MAG: hypothetical protein ACE5FT_04570 [Candidatus Nanoarchaeia archaeon]
MGNKKLILDRFKQYGFTTQTAIVRALHDAGFYQNSSSRSMKAFLSQVVNGHRPAPDELVEGLSKICESDTELLRLISPYRPSQGLEYELERALNENYDSFVQHFRSLNRKSKLELYINFESYIKDVIDAGLEND